MGSTELLHESGEEAEPAICPACGGEGVSVGVLGRLRLKWFRCRQCCLAFEGEDSQ